MERPKIEKISFKGKIYHGRFIIKIKLQMLV